MKQLLILLLVIGIHGFSQEIDKDLAHLNTLTKTDTVDNAVKKGLAYLATKQNPQTGAFSYQKMPNTMTALACLALMADGHLSKGSTYGENLRKGILYLVEKGEKGKGYYGNEGNGRMYSQGICTLALGEAYGMMPTGEENLRVGGALKRSLTIIIDAQVSAKGQHRGGWHYEPKSTSSDLSVSVWQILALRSALNCNMDIPDTVVNNAIAYVRRSYNKKVKTFTYDGNRVTHSMRAGGGTSLLALRAGTSSKDKQMIRNSASSLINYNPAQGSHYYYQNFSLALCCTMLGENYIKQIRPKLEDALIAQQLPDGSFKKHSGTFGGIYSTSFAVLSLSLRRNLLPISQN